MISKEATKEIRRFANKNSYHSYNSAPIKIVDGNISPCFRGNSFRWETKSGKPVYYPNAYKKAFGKPIYIPSTKHIVVGKEWLAKLEKDLLHVRMCKQSKKFVHRNVVEFIFNFGD